MSKPAEVETELSVFIVIEVVQPGAAAGMAGM
jgi:hypothetical protein